MSSSSPATRRVSQGISVMRTVDWDERQRSTAQLARALQPQFQALPGVTAFPVTPPSLGQGFRERPINYVIVSSDSYDNLARVSQQFARRDWPRTRASCRPTPICG